MSRSKRLCGGDKFGAASARQQNPMRLAPPQTNVLRDVVSVHDGGNAITLYFAEIKLAKALRDSFTAKAVGHTCADQMAGGAGFEPALPFGRTDLQSAAFNHSATPVYSQGMAGAADFCKTPPPKTREVGSDAATGRRWD